MPAGLPTADPEALDPYAILAGQALTAAGPGDVIIVATGNIRHLSRFPGIRRSAVEYDHVSVWSALVSLGVLAR